MMGCKVCGREPAKSYRDAVPPVAVFTCSQCLQDAADVGAATKKVRERLFTQAAFIHEVWDQDNARAKYLMDLARQKMDRRLCIRIRDQVSDLKLRQRWLAARYDGTTLPRTTQAVKQLFEREFNRSYPNGVSDIDPDHNQTHEYQAFPDSKTRVLGSSTKEALLT
ncbi:hypothetical protein [Desulfosarcina alkanivorans]|uniref:hypothetical protein n=1 Tax=Desulfosarcina alkanivorans TaxID=571177 RepID=UPI0012D2BBCC|nr:hypothetical protein [Desulfosarcina alkanivorans]